MIASIKVNKCLEPLDVIASRNSAVSLFLNKVTFLTSTKLFFPFFSIKKSNLVSLLKKTSGLIRLLFVSSLIKLFSKIGIILVDFKLEFGKNDNEIILADEISPDNCRLWDKKSKLSLDKDLFRHDKGDLINAYEYIHTKLNRKLNV